MVLAKDNIIIKIITESPVFIFLVISFITSCVFPFFISSTTSFIFLFIFYLFYFFILSSYYTEFMPKFVAFEMCLKNPCL